MSAFNVSDNHIIQIATYAVNNNLAGGDGQEICNILRAENTKSVNYRYRETTEPAPIDFENAKRFLVGVDPRLYLVQIVKACTCLDYQSCETPTYEESKACAIINEIKSDATGNIIRSLPEYDKVEWEIL